MSQDAARVGAKVIGEDGDLSDWVKSESLTRYLTAGITMPTKSE
jgi:hypothetical protein